MFFRLETVAPRSLNVEAALPALSLRVLLDQDGRDLSARVAHEVLVRQLQPLERGVARQVVKSRQDLLETLMRQAAAAAAVQLPPLRAAALQEWRASGQREIGRLTALAAVNPAVSPEEIRVLEKRLLDGEKALAELRCTAHAVRLVVAT
jgi:ATP-dependent helicase HepA